VRRRSVRGALIVVAMFVLGGLVLWGLFLAPRAKSPPAPAGVAWGAPDRPLRVVSYNILHGERGLDRVADDVRKLEPDIVLLQEVESRDLPALAAALGMQQHYHPTHYFRSENLAGRRSTWGNAIFSKVPLYDAGSIPSPGGGSFGVWAVAVVDGKKFLVAGVHLSATWNANPAHIKQSGEYRYKELTNLVTAWRDRGSPPIVVGGDFNQIPLGNNYHVMTEHWTDALAQLGHTDHTFRAGLLRTRIDYLLISPEWSAREGGVADSDASDHRPIWVQITAATTRPSTRAAGTMKD
jgi:endonuclease/exonuclease/phosphatase family metal-dependent hydrolase